MNRRGTTMRRPSPASCVHVGWSRISAGPADPTLTPPADNSDAACSRRRLHP